MIASKKIRQLFPNAILFDAHVHPYIESLYIPTETSVTQMNELLKEASLDGAIMLMHAQENQELNYLSNLLSSMKLRRLIPALELNTLLTYNEHLIKCHCIYLNDELGLIPAHPFKNHGIIHSMYTIDHQLRTSNKERVPIDYAEKSLEHINELSELNNNLFNLCKPYKEEIELMKSKGIKTLIGTDVHLGWTQRLGYCGSIMPGEYGGLNIDNIMTALTNNEIECFFTNDEHVYYTEKNKIHQL